MNAQTLIDTTPSQTFDFSTFWKSKKSNSSQVNSFNNFNKEDDKRFVARSGNIEYHQVSQAKGLSHSPFSLKPTKDSFPTDNSLKPRTLNYTKLKKARSDLQWEKELNNLQIKQL